MVAVLELAGITKRYRRRGPWVLADAALSVRPGEGVQIVGTNGSGKTTLLRIAAGLARPTDGSVRRTGAATYVPERLVQAVPMTVRTYLTHQARVQGLRGSAVVGAVAAVIEDHELDPVADRPVRDLSKGWLQRTVLAQALVARPALLLLDEPWTGIDDPGHWHLRTVIERALGDGAALLMTSHEATRVAGVRRVHLTAGRITEAPPTGAPDVAPARAGVAGDRVVLLVARDGAHPDPRALVGLPGCVAQRPTAEGVELVVDARDGDGLLAHAIASGWHVQRVTPWEPA